jgi:2-methylcitrate dehydratase PrpD
LKEKQMAQDSGFLALFDGAWQRAAAEKRDSVTAEIRRNWFDTLAATAGGVAANCTQAALEASLAGGSDALRPADVALVLGTASHALDYDDVCMIATCHPSAPPVAALLGLLPVLEQHRPGLQLQDIFAAYLLGTEATLRLGQWLGFRHYSLGFHATDTLGVVGAAASCAHALGLPREQAHAALAIAASSAGGLRANFGTDTKPLHVGFAAAAAIRAVLLAKSGAQASDDVWGPAGFFHAFNGGAPMEPLPWTANMDWAIDQPGFELKRFPSCYLTHRLIAGTLKLRERRTAAERAGPVRIEIEVPKNGLSALKYPQPANGLQAKFSGPYCAAAAWYDGKVELASFADSAIPRPAVQALMRRTSLIERGTDGEALESAPVHLTLRGEGWIDTITVDWAPGSAADPMTRDQQRSKWRDCASQGGMDADDAQALRLLDAPLHTPASDLLRPLRQSLLAAIRHSIQR